MSKPQILIVQDNPADIDLLRMAFEQLQESYEIVTLKDGAEALRFVQGRYTGVDEPEPCVILLNLYLPKYDGIEVLRALRKEPNLEHVQVVMVTAAALPKREVAEIDRMGATMRQKPRQFSEVLELARYLLELCKKPIAAT